MSLFEEIFEFYDVSNLKEVRVLIIMEPATRKKLKTLHQQWLVCCMDEMMDTLLEEIDVNLSDPFSRMKSELEDEQSTKVGDEAKKLWKTQKEKKFSKVRAIQPWCDANKKKGKLFKKYIKDVDPLAMVEFEGWNAVMELKSKRTDPKTYMVSFQQVVVRFVDPKERELKGKHFVEKKIDPFSGRAVVNVNVSPFVVSRSNKFIERCKTLGYI